MEKQKKAIVYYDNFSKVYDIFSSKHYYHRPRECAVNELQLEKGQTILNIPCGTGQNFEYFQKVMTNTGKIVGIDLSEGMLSKARIKIQKNDYTNIVIAKGDATKINTSWIDEAFESGLKFDAILCDLGLSGFPDWENIIDNLILLLQHNGRLVIMDWYIEKQSLRGALIKWIGKGEVNRTLYKYMKSKVANFRLDDSFKGGDMFVASGNQR